MPTEEDARVADAGQRGASHTATIVNWILALLTVAGAAAAVLIAYGLTLGTAGCTDRSCPHLHLGNLVFGPVIYGAPVVAVLTIAVSFVTASRRRGWVVPLVAWILLVAGPLLLVLAMH
ncbi:MAG: hypothetical protein QOJ80_7556 [Mycobacterium sp.]|jgi:hypothetical protein|nr:hypothetical protein [Mycobacterium sp.]